MAVSGKVCKTDVTKLCAGIAPGAGGIRACIKLHMAEVSDLPGRDVPNRGWGRRYWGAGIFRSWSARAYSRILSHHWGRSA